MTSSQAGELWGKSKKIREVHRSFFSYSGSIALSFFLMAAVSFFLLPLLSRSYGMELVLSASAISFLLLLRVYWDYVGNYLIIDGEELVDVNKLFPWAVKKKNIKLSHIRSAHARFASALHRRFDVGDVVMEVDEIKGDVVLRSVKDPEGVVYALRGGDSVMAQAEPKSKEKRSDHDDTEGKMLKLMGEIRKKVGDETFEKLADKARKSDEFLDDWKKQF